MKKGALQMDFIIAVGIFIIIFALVVQTITVFFKTGESTSEIYTLSGDANSLLGIADFGYSPDNWNGSGSLDRIGISTKAYRFYIIVNNSQSFYYNQSQSVADLTNEKVSFNYTSMGFSNIDINSTVIYDGNGEVSYSISSDNITFITSISANTVKAITVYFDDDSSFTSRSSAISGNDTIKETAHAVQPIRVIQYKKLVALNSSNYTSVKSALLSRDFHITLRNSATNSVFLDYGGEVPRIGNVVALQRYLIFQNSTGGVTNGKLTIQAW